MTNAINKACVLNGNVLLNAYTTKYAREIKKLQFFSIMSFEWAFPLNFIFLNQLVHLKGESSIFFLISFAINNI